MQTILGAGGPVGIALAEALPEFTSRIRLVSRNPESVNPGDELHPADLLKPEQVRKAVAGSEVAYLTVGLPYRLSVWQKNWPPIMDNVIEACAAEGTRLVFFDNVYMYHPDDIPHMTEEARHDPVSRKGKVRLDVLNRLLDAMAAGRVEATVARAADFYGPGKSNSVLVETVFKNLQKGKPAIWLASTRHKHSFTYTPDAGRATALLGNSPEAFGQSWHLPTAPEPPTGAEWIQQVAQEIGVQPKTRVTGSLMLGLLGLFTPELGEIREMLYQYEQDYFFDSSKFDRQFDFQTTPYQEGIREILRLGLE